MKQPLRLILVGLFFALMFVGAAANAYLIFGTLYTTSSSGWMAKREGERVVIAYLSPNAPDGLRLNDEIVAINGQSIKDIPDRFNFFQSAELGKPYTLVVRRDGELHELSLNTVPLTRARWAELFIMHVLSQVIFLSVGFTLFLLKPYDKQALLLALLFGMVAINDSRIELAPERLQLLMFVNSILASFMFAVFFHFSLIFPEPSRILRKIPRAELLLYLPALVFNIPVAVIIAYAQITGPERVEAFLPPLLPTIFQIVALVYVTGGLLVMVGKYKHAGQGARRKLRVLLAGMLIGAVPELLLITAQLIYGPFTVYRVAGEWLLVAVPLLLLLVPLSFAYAIARHQVIPVSLLIRGSVKYLLAKNGLRILMALPVIGIVLSILSNPERNLSDILFRNTIHFYLLLIVAATVGLFFRRRVTEWIDRKFFREAYQQEKILRELIDDVRKLDSIREMSRRVAEQVESALHPEQVYLFYREENARNLSLSYSSGGASRELKIPEDFQLLRFMELHGGAQEFPFPQKNNLPPGEKEWLAQLGTHLIVPMSGTDNRLTGLFLMGQKKSEVPYTATDRELLETLADQVAIVYENVRLKERVEQDRKTRREVLARFEGTQLNLLKECPQCGACYDGAVQACAHDASELVLTLPVERNVEGRYRLDRLVGRGGMGAVYQATDLRLNRSVALKILTGSMFGNSEALRRFEREAQASARLNHPSIVTIFDYGVLQTEGAYLVMELLEGCTLGAAIRRKGFVACAVAARWFDEVLEAVRAAHEAGIIHRDLKPENVFIVREGDGREHIKILDFGLAKIAQNSTLNQDGATASVTTPGTVMGTFGYMSPEQLTGGRVDERSDLFAVGVMMVEALVGRRPFAGRTYTELLNNVLHGSFHLPGTSPEELRLDEALQKCLAKEPEARFRSAAEMQSALVPAIRACPALARERASEPDADTFII